MLSSGDVTVVVPTRNRAGLLDQCLSTVRWQVGGAPAVIVVDDGSREVVKELPEGLEGAVVRLPGPLGAAAARNAGLQRVDTPWVAFLDDDDLWAPTKLRCQLRALSDTPAAGWCYTSAVVVDDELRVLGAQRARVNGWIESDLLKGNAIAGGGSCVVARTSDVVAVGGFAQHVRAAEDWHLWARLARRAQVVAVDEPLAAWRRHRGNKSATWSVDAVSEMEVELRARAAELGVTFEHGFFVQSVIDGYVRSGARGSGSRAYWSRFRSDGAVRDAVAAAAMLVAPRKFDMIKRWEHRRAVPRSWDSKVGWLGELDAAVRMRRGVPAAGL